MDKILVFAGTTEGRKLCELAEKNNMNIVACVATEYGEELLTEMKNTKILKGRLTSDEMAELIKKECIKIVIDATHPYATVVTENIKKACEECNVEYVRLLRESYGKDDNVISLQKEEVVQYFIKNKGNILFTIGSKELKDYKNIPDFTNRVFARVLPSEEVIRQCKDLGFMGRNLICMQGPFSKSLNYAMLKEYNCKYLLTKDTGSVGGFFEKVEAAKIAEAKVVVVERPKNETGYSFEEVAERFFNETIQKRNRYFPIFIKNKNTNVLIVGGGNIAQRRIEKLLEYDFKLKVVAPKLKDEIEISKIDYQQREFKESDLENVDIVIAATNSREVNGKIAKLCSEKHIFCSIADKKEECSFLFPSTIKYNDFVIGLCSEGKSPSHTKNMRIKLEKMLNNMEE